MGARLLAMAAVAAMFASCTDPVRDEEIAALGGEADGVEPGPEHRPGQPCVVCHSEGGPASQSPFVIAGTIYEAPTGSKGAEGVTVELVDAQGSFPMFKPVTNRAGNFWVTKAEWRELTYAVKVLILPPGGAPPIPMGTVINREGSCNACHAPFAGPDATPEDLDRQRSSVGQIFAGAGGAR